MKKAFVKLRRRFGCRIMKVKETEGFSYSIVDENGKEIEQGFTNREGAEDYLKRLNIGKKALGQLDPEGFSR